MHKCIKYEYQPSGKGLLLTNSTSIGEYLYVGILRYETNQKEKINKLSIQGKTSPTNQLAPFSLTWMKEPTYQPPSHGNFPCTQIGQMGPPVSLLAKGKVG